MSYLFASSWHNAGTLRHDSASLRDVPGKCAICSGKNRALIDLAVVGGSSRRHIAAQYKVSSSSVQRHVAQCFGVADRTVMARDAAYVESSLARVRKLIAAAQQVVDTAPHEYTALEAMRELGRLIELEAKLSGELVKRVDATVTQGPQTPREALDLFDRMRPALEAQAAEDAASEGKH